MQICGAEHHCLRLPTSLVISVVDVGMMTFQIAMCLACVLAYVARKQFNVDVVLVGTMTFEVTTHLACVLAYVARKQFNVNVVLVGTIPIEQVRHTARLFAPVVPLLFFRNALFF